MTPKRGRPYHQSKFLNTSRGRRDGYLEPQNFSKINGHKFWIRSSGKVINFTLTTPSDRLIAAFLQTREEREPSDHVEEQIYDTFTGNEDQSVMDRFHELDWSHRTPLLEQLADERSRALGQRLIYVEAPNVMAESVRRDYDTAIARHLMGADGAVPWLTLPKAIEEVDDLLSVANDSENALLTELRHYLIQRSEEASELLA